MKKTLKLILILFSLGIFIFKSGPVFADGGTTGTLAGNIKDKDRYGKALLYFEGGVIVGKVLKNQYRPEGRFSYSSVLGCKFALSFAATCASLTNNIHCLTLSISR